VDDVRLEETANLVAIQQLQAAYADAVTRRAWPELTELFLPDCPVEIDTRKGEPIRVVGGDGVGTFVEAAIARFDFFEFVILSSHLYLDGPDEARGRLYLCEVRHEREPGVRSEAFGLYHDHYRRLDGRWWFARRQYSSLARTATDPDQGRAMDTFPVPDLF
jgi:hypothetical protein